MAYQPSATERLVVNVLDGAVWLITDGIAVTALVVLTLIALRLFGLL